MASPLPSAYFSLSDGIQTIRLWELSGGECLEVLKGHGDSVRSLDVPRGPDGSFADLNPMTGEADSASALNGLAFSNACLTGSYDCTAKLWDLRSPQVFLLRTCSFTPSWCFASGSVALPRREVPCLECQGMCSV